MDLSQYSDEELKQIAYGTQSKAVPQEESTGLGDTLRSLGKGYLNYAGGALRGMGQAAGDFGASAINWPISGIEHLTGAKLPHVPHPHLINENTDSMAEAIGQALGQFAGGIGLPGGAAIKTAQLANKGYRALRYGKEVSLLAQKDLPLIARLLAGSAGGALEGAAGNEEDRKLGTLIGGAAGAAGYGAPSAIKYGLSVKSKNIAKKFESEISRLQKYFDKTFNLSLKAGEEAGANKFLKAEEGNLELLKKAGEGKNLHGLNEFNKNPTLSNAHKAQSDLNNIIFKYSKLRENSLQSDAYEEASRLKDNLLQKISNAFEASGVKKQGKKYSQARTDYAKHMGPYLKSKTINDLLGKNKDAVQKIRPSKFADKLLQDEEFLSVAGHKHPELLRRETLNNLKKNKIAKVATVAVASGLGATFLPYHIKKALGIH